MLGVLATQDAFQNQRLLRIVVGQVNDDVVAFHVIQKEAQFGIVLLGGAPKFHVEARLIGHGEARQRVPKNDFLRVVLVRLLHAQIKIVGARRLVADKANAHFRMHHIRIGRVFGLLDLETESQGAASLGIERQFFQSAHVDIDVKAQINLDCIETFDVGVFNRRAGLDGAHIIFIIRTFKGDVVLRRVLPRNRERRFLESRGLECFHEGLGFDAKDVLVDVVVRHGAAVNRLTVFNVAFKLGFICERKLRIVSFHAKSRKFGALGQCKANFLDRVGNRLEKLAEKNAVGKRDAKEEFVRLNLFQRAHFGLLGHVGRIQLLVGHDDGLFRRTRFGIRVACNFGFLEFGLDLALVLGFIFRRDERVLLVRIVRARRLRVTVGAFRFLLDVFVFRHFATI